MNLHATALLGLAALALGSFIYYYEIEGESARRAALDAEQRIHQDVEAASVERIELSSMDGIAARFERIDGRWMMTAPVSARADATALDAIADSLSSLRREGVVEDPSALDQYGLGPDSRTIRFVAAGMERGLRIGGSTPVGGHLYVARLADDDVAYVESFRINAFNRNLDDLRDRQILHVAADEFLTLRISWPGTDGVEEVALARDASGEWQMGVPVVGRADSQTIRDLLTDLTYLRATGFVDVATEQTEAALAHPEISIHWTLPGDHAERRLLIGSVAGGETLVEGPDGRRATIAAARIDDFARDVVAYRFKSLSEFDLVDARYLTLDFPAAGTTQEGNDAIHVEATRTEAGWSGTAPEIDAQRASALVRELSSLRAIDILADEMGPNELASLGLSPPRARILVGGGDKRGSLGETLSDVSLGRLDPDRGIFAQRSGASTIFVLAASVVEEIPISGEAFVSGFEAESGALAVDGEELDSEYHEIDSLEGVEIP